MTATVAVPFVLALVATHVVTVMHLRLPPRLTTWILALVGTATALSGAWLVITVSLAFIGQRNGLDRWLGWCDDVLSTHDVVSAPLGLASIVVAFVMFIAAARTIRRYRRAWRLSSDDHTEIVDDPRMIAHAVPARGKRLGTVVVSTGIINALDSAELGAVMAHEKAHLEHRHHRFLVLIDVAAAVMPLLRPLRGHVRLATERWADEDAAVAVGSRHLVASAVAHAALADSSAAYVMAMSGGSTVVRVAALIDSPRRGHVHNAMVGTAAATAFGVLAATMVQVHHTLTLFAHLCT